MKISAYLERINHDGSIGTDTQTLYELHRAHMLTVPFENLDIGLRRKILIIEQNIYEKIGLNERENLGAWAFLVMVGAIFVFLGGIGLTGWIRSRAAGIVTTTFAAHHNVLDRFSSMVRYHTLILTHRPSLRALRVHLSNPFKSRLE